MSGSNSSPPVVSKKIKIKKNHTFESNNIGQIRLRRMWSYFKEREREGDVERSRRGGPTERRRV